MFFKEYLKIHGFTGQEYEEQLQLPLFFILLQ